MCKVKKDRWKEGMCWLLATVWKIRNEQVERLEEKIIKLKGELSAKDLEISITQLKADCKSGKKNVS